MSRFDDRLEQEMQHIADTATPSSTAWEAIQTRIAEQADYTELEITMLKPNPRTEPAVPARMLIAAAAAVLLVIIGLFALLNDGEEQSLRVTETDTSVPATTAAPGTTEPPADAGDASADPNVAVVLEFMQARAAHDGEAMRTLIADDATIVRAHEWIDTSDGYLTLDDFERANQMLFTNVECTPGSPGRVRCTYSMESGLTQVLGVGPYPNSLVLDVSDGLITNVNHNRSTNSEPGDDGFYAEVYFQNFVPWLDENHPGDLARMFSAVSVDNVQPPDMSEESVALWEDRVPEFISSFSSGGDVAVAEAFIAARNAYDGAAVLALFANDAFVRDDLRRTNTGEFFAFDEIDYVFSGEFDRVTGVELVDANCAAGSPGRVRCTYTWENAWTQALGDNRYVNNSFVFDISDGQIDGLTHTFAQGPVDGFEDHISEVQTLWLQNNHPDDLATMRDGNGFARNSVESLALWERYTTEFASSLAGAGD